MATRTRTQLDGSAKLQAKTVTPWGKASVVEELKLAQRAGEKRFASSFQVLETETGERLLRISYSTGDVTRRGPVTLRARDLDRLRAGLASRPFLREALGLNGGEV